MNRDNFQCFILSELGHDGRSTSGEHRFSRAGRTDEQHVMPASGSYLKRPFRRLLTDHIREIVTISPAHRDNRGRTRCRQRTASQLIDEVVERCGRSQIQGAYPCSLVDVRRR